MNVDILTRKNASLADLRAALDALPSQEDAEREVDALEEQRRAALLTGTDADVAALEKKITASNRTVERLAVARNELQRRVDEAEAAAKAAARRVRANAIDARADEAAKLLRQTMATVVPAILQMLAEVARAEAAVTEHNRDLAPGEPGLAGPEERVRHRQTLHEKIVSRKPVMRWAFERDGSLLGAEWNGQVEVSPNDENVGIISTQSGGHRLRRRQFIEETLLPEKRGGHAPPPLALQLMLPAFMDPDPIWSPAEPWMSHIDIARRAEDALALLQESDQDTRWPVTRLVPVTNEVTK